MSSDPCVQNTVKVKSLGNRSTSFNAGISNQICFPYSSIGSPYSHLNPFWTVCIWENMMLCIAESLAIPFSRMQTCLRWDYSQPPRSGVVATASSMHGFPKPVQPDHATPRGGAIAPVSSKHSFPKPVQPDHATPRSGVIAPVSS